MPVEVVVGRRFESRNGVHRDRFRKNFARLKGIRDPLVLFAGRSDMRKEIPQPAQGRFEVL
jgi:hypothetical protein